MNSEFPKAKNSTYSSPEQRKLKYFCAKKGHQATTESFVVFSSYAPKITDEAGEEQKWKGERSKKKKQLTHGVQVVKALVHADNLIVEFVIAAGGGQEGVPVCDKHIK